MDGSSNDRARKVPSHEVTYARLRDMVLYGHLEPGQAVTIQGLIRDLGAGMTPVREAIRRLSAEGALTAQGNRRVAVPAMTAALVDQVAFARLAIEPRMAALAAPNLDPAVIRRLEEADARVDHAIRVGDIPAYLAGNLAFHFTLYEAAGTPILLDLARSLWLRFGPSLRVVCARYGDLELPDRHAEVLAAARAADSPALARAIERDIMEGVDQVRAALALDG
ncbi:MAG: GntR family transcriptional regulator [Gemmobacter sp.]